MYKLLVAWWPHKLCMAGACLASLLEMAITPRKTNGKGLQLWVVPFVLLLFILRSQF
jgi:hypothetical protein